MRLHEIANSYNQPVVVEHPESGTFILLPDCQLVDLNWKRLKTSCNIRYDSNWTESILFKFELKNGHPNVLEM